MPDLFDKVLYKTNEATTMSDIAYLPSGAGAVKAAIKSLARMKQDWGIEILDSSEGRRVMFEDQLSIFVPHCYWNDFSSMFDESLDNGHVGLGRYLREAMDEELKRLQGELKPAIAKMLSEDVFKQLDKSVNVWRARFGIKDYQTSGVLVMVEDRERDIQKLIAGLIKVYGEDRGNLELLLGSISGDKPLNTFKLFRDKDYLYGTRILSVYQGVSLVFEAVIDPTHTMTQSVMVEDQDVVDELESDENVKAVGNVLYPVGSSFGNQIFRELKVAINTVVE